MTMCIIVAMLEAMTLSRWLGAWRRGEVCVYVRLHGISRRGASAAAVSRLAANVRSAPARKLTAGRQR